MVHMDTHPDWPILFENLTKFRSDSLREENRNARSNPDEFNVLYRTQAGEQVLELPVGKQQRIPARKENVADVGMGFDITQTLPGFRMKGVGLRVPKPRAARTRR